MPNLKTKNIAMPNFPIKFGNSKFLYKATSKREESLIKVLQNSEEFFIQIKEKNDFFLIKADKISRPSQVAFVQLALREFRDMCKCEAIFSNIEPNKIKDKKKYTAIKDIDFFANKFKNEKEIRIEVGFGSGRHLLYQAKKYTDIQFIGLEIHKPSIEQVAKQCELQAIENIFILDYDARVFLEFLNSNSVGKIFVHFPVPWDKKPHRRVISSEFIEESTRVLKPGGTLELRTDSEKYFNYSLEEFLDLNRLNLHINKNKNLDISSKYEDRWKKQEKDIYDLTLTNEEISKEKQSIGKINFASSYKFKNIIKNFQPIVINEKDCFLHVENIFAINEDDGLIKISFGASTKNERCYVEFFKDKTSYFPDNILGTKANRQAHNLLIKWLNKLTMENTK